MQIRKATVQDTDLLIRLRLDYLREDQGELSPEEQALITNQLRDYFTTHLSMGDFIALLAGEGQKTMAVAFLVITEKPANPAFITGNTGTILNVLTYPEYRRRGIAYELITALIGEARGQGVSQLELSATAQGRPLYEKLGFHVSQYTPMRLGL